MMLKIRYILLSVLVVFLLSANYITNFEYNGLYLRPEDPPRLMRNFFSTEEITSEEVKQHQERIKVYIEYLEEYYISVGRYYNGDDNVPIFKHRNDGCKLYEYIFRDIVLPKAPTGEAREIDVDLIITRLTEHIQDLRSRIKENNRHNHQLREYYRECFVKHEG